MAQIAPPLRLQRSITEAPSSPSAPDQTRSRRAGDFDPRACVTGAADHIAEAPVRRRMVFAPGRRGDLRLMPATTRTAGAKSLLGGSPLAAASMQAAHATG